MRFINLLPAFVFLPFTTSHPSSSSSKITTYTFPVSNTTFPEGIARQPNSPYFYSGSITTGTIYRGNVFSPYLELFIPGGTSGLVIAAGMKATPTHLFVAGATAGTVFVFNLEGEARLVHTFSNGLSENATILNDLVLARDGTVYIIDSIAPIIWVITPEQLQGKTVEQELGVLVRMPPEVAGTGFVGNGIVITDDQKYLLVGDVLNRRLYRVSLESREVDLIDLGGGEIGAIDGALIRGSYLYCVNGDSRLGNFIDVVKILPPYLEGKVVGQIRSPLLYMPSTAAFDGDDLLVVNFQFRNPTPTVPFTIVRVPSKVGNY